MTCKDALWSGVKQEREVQPGDTSELSVHSQPNVLSRRIEAGPPPGMEADPNCKPALWPLGVES